jgi:transcriptional regulator with PAS, ATPase and Fis domain
MTLQELREDIIKKALAKHNNNKIKAAKELGVTAKTIHNYVNRFKTKQSK